MQRRDFLAGSLATGAGLWMAGCTAADGTDTQPDNTQTQGESPMAFQQPELPYALGALAPFLSENQMDFHYNKHHAGYFKKLNAAVEGTPQAERSLRELVIESDGGVYNNAAQAWNHTFFWECMTPEGGGGEPTGELAEAIKRDFGSVDAMKKEFSDTATGVFGSGWGWLAKDKDGKLKVLPGSNADNPLKDGMEPILTVDVWEHAYYLDYQNLRADFVKGFWDYVNWDHASEVYSG